MNFSKEISDELNTISSLLGGIEKKNVFSVPAGYFDVLTIDILKRVNATSKADNLTVPEGYFENLTTSVLNKIKLLNDNDNPARELRALSPMLYSVQNENVFSVPAGYFKNLQNDILHKTISEAKVVAIKPKDSIWKYAAAAVVTGMIAVSSLMNFNSRQSAPVNESFVTPSAQTTAQFNNEQQINAAIAGLSDDEIIKYLDKTGTDADNELLTKSIDENGLPAANDYLLNDKTLDTYLNQSNKSSQN